MSVEVPLKTTAGGSELTRSAGELVSDNPLQEWLPEIIADAVVVHPDDILAESRGNLWSFSLTPSELENVTLKDLEVFAYKVTDARRKWLSAHGKGPMILYWWHDGQAGQLRCSMVSKAHGGLPFGCEVVTAGGPGEIASEWLRSSQLHGVPRSELNSPALGDESPEPSLHVLKVWSVQLP
jgi:hypothetical protein